MKALIILFPATSGACLVYLLRRFLVPRFKSLRFVGDGLLFILHLLLYVYIGNTQAVRSIAPGAVLFWYLVMLLGAAFLFYRGPLKAGIYLAVTFFAVCMLSMQMMEHTGYTLYHMAKRMYFPADGADMPSLLFYTCRFFTAVPYPQDAIHGIAYNFIFLLVLGGACVLMVLSCRCLAGKIKYRALNMNWTELGFMMIPACTGIFFYIFMTFVSQVLFEQAAVELASDYGPLLYLLVPALTMILLLAVLYSCDVYEQIMALGEEKGKAAMLESQVEQMEGHIHDIEQLYTGIRSMKYDMQNYLFDIKSLLYEKGICLEAEEDGLGTYFAGIGKALEELDYIYHTGNPVTDVVINGKYRQAVKLGIGFECSFQYPADYGISVFDISIILNNALNNAVEACLRLKEQKAEEGVEIKTGIGVESYCKNNMFLLEINNSFDGILFFEKKGHCLLTRKKNSFEHGLGFQNIRQCAEKYFGGADYEYSENKFRLTVMLQRVYKAGK